ncbi:class F sortase [Streptacidiphilus sp. N1-12]|uniref:Class F sortase n=2 Tax=Streptacidiphilus alkalitolerans TaxID=3342712 RepID=A0ABV6WGP3_9ACTN
MVPAVALLIALAGCAAPATPSVSAPPSASASGPGSATAAAPAAPTPRATVPPAASALARSVPVRLKIPGIGVDTPVMQLGLAADGTVAVPPIEAHAPAGWYRGSPTPGQVGPAVILGHVTVGQFGDGVFLHLDRMRAGDRIVVVLEDGVSATFAVDSVQTVAKSQFPTSSVYGNVDHPALRLITCGGVRAADGSGYTDNVVVYASLLPAG